MPTSPDKAKATFQALLKASLPRQTLTIEQAKAQLRAVDPDIDLRPIIKALNENDWEKALAHLLAELPDEYWQALLKPIKEKGFEALLKVIHQSLDR